MYNLKLIILIFLATTVFASFSSPQKPETGNQTNGSEKSCYISCQWHSSYNTYGLVSISDCCSDDYQTNVASSTRTIDYASGSIEITTQMAVPHHGANLKVWRNGNLVHSHFIGMNSSEVCTVFFSGIACTDTFEVTF